MTILDYRMDGLILMPEQGPKTPWSWPLYPEEYEAACKDFCDHLRGHDGIMMPLEVQFGSLSAREKILWAEHADVNSKPKEPQS